MSKKIATSDRLADALTAAGAPADMVIRARGGYYDDFKSQLPAPIVQLVRDAEAAGLPGIALRAKEGEFDATRWESEAWLKSSEGQETVQKLRGI